MCFTSKEHFTNQLKLLLSPKLGWMDETTTTATSSKMQEYKLRNKFKLSLFLKVNVIC
jgi:hypothetical protein